MREQSKLLQTWILLEKVFQSGQLSFDQDSNRLFITQPLARLLMAHGADGWVNSIHGIYQYLYWKQSQQAWDKFFREEELASVRHALAENPNLQRQDIERIKRSRREEIAFSDLQPPKAEPFEFFIIPNSTASSVEPLGIGHYDPTTEDMEVATWEEVRDLLKQK